MKLKAKEKLIYFFNNEAEQYFKKHQQTHKNCADFNFLCAVKISFFCMCRGIYVRPIDWYHLSLPPSLDIRQYLLCVKNLIDGTREVRLCCSVEHRRAGASHNHIVDIYCHGIVPFMHRSVPLCTLQFDVDF
jgi:hypothetical protein